VGLCLSERGPNEALGTDGRTPFVVQIGGAGGGRQEGLRWKTHPFLSRLSKGDDICGWCLGGRLKIYLAGHIPGAVDVSTVRRLAFQVREVVVDAKKGLR